MTPTNSTNSESQANPQEAPPTDTPATSTPTTTGRKAAVPKSGKDMYKFQSSNCVEW